MSCFWDTLFRNINHEPRSVFVIDYYAKKEYDLIDYYKKIPKNIQELCLLFKEKNKLTKHVICNGEQITEKQMKENYEHIKNYDTKTMNSGYLCSTFDPFLFLTSELFEVKVINNYMTFQIVYENRNKNNYEIIVNNNDSHMW